MYERWPQLHREQQARALRTLISVSCHSACCVLSITERWYHAIDSVSTIVGETARGVWSMVPPIHHSTIGWGDRTEPFFQMDQITLCTPCFPLAMHWKNEICLHCLPQKKERNQFHSPICGSIGTMGLRTSICPLCDIPNSFTITSAVLRSAFWEQSSKIFISRSKIVCIRSTLWQWCDVSNKCFWSMPYNAWVSSICWVQSLLLTIVLWLVYLFWGNSTYWCGEHQLTPHGWLSFPVPMWSCVLRLLCYCGALFILLLLPNARWLNGPSWPLGLLSLKLQTTMGNFSTIYLLLCDWEWLLVQTYCSHCLSLWVSSPT